MEIEQELVLRAEAKLAEQAKKEVDENEDPEAEEAERLLAAAELAA